MGIVNITPDSFSDGGLHDDAHAAFAAGMAMVHDGATILDLGAESTRPGADAVSADDELARLLPALELIRPATEALISIDTSKARVAAAALVKGADMINDVRGLRGDPELAHVVADAGVPVVLMHMRGEPRTMQDAPSYEDPVQEVLDELQESVDIARGAGILDSRILLDPGIGFAKRFEDNRAILQALDRFVALGFPVVLGVSRKSLIGRALQDRDGKVPPPRERDIGTVALTTEGWRAGVAVHRVHNVRFACEALRTLEAFGRKNGE
ncbi:MAG: dihydropteroate synthase [Planctomycetes bacterium]|nr:dihydropteroate synthase [Planctomycetota bacterium]